VRHVHVPILLDEINKINMVQLRNELKLRQQAATGRKLEFRDQLIKGLEKKLPKYTDESLAKKKAAATEAKKKNTVDGLSSFSKTETKSSCG
jgi:pyruvate/2-oxoglutarate dehydrogenase complex dihydrolipoamide acyltransferase (E2) component